MPRRAVASPRPAPPCPALPCPAPLRAAALPGALALLLGFSSPSLAQPEGVPPLADHLLWCGSAMFWLAGDAEEEGASKDLETFDAWSEALTGAAVTLLEADGWAGEAVGTLIDDYDVEVLEQMAQDTMRYDPEGCFSLIEPVDEPAGETT